MNASDYSGLRTDSAAHAATVATQTLLAYRGAGTGFFD